MDGEKEHYEGNIDGDKVIKTLFELALDIVNARSSTNKPELQPAFYFLLGALLPIQTALSRGNSVDLYDELKTMAIQANDGLEDLGLYLDFKSPKNNSEYEQFKADAKAKGHQVAEPKKKVIGIKSESSSSTH